MTLPMTPQENHSLEDAPQYLTFQLQEGTYGIGIELIREIRAIGTVAPLPGSPPYVRGIMNLRGAIVPVIDLRIRLGLPPAESHSRFAVTIITKLDTKSIGLIADGVNEVLSIPNSSLQKSKSLLEHGDRRFIQALALVPTSSPAMSSTKSESTDMIVLLNLERLYDPTLDSMNPLTAGEAGTGRGSEVNEQSASITALHQSLTNGQNKIHSSKSETSA